MPPAGSLTRITATLLPVTTPPSGGRPRRCRRYRLLVVGDAVMRRPAVPGEPWRIDVTTDGSFLPLPHRSLAGLRRILDDGGRLGAVLLEPLDRLLSQSSLQISIAIITSPSQLHNGQAILSIDRLIGQQSLQPPCRFISRYHMVEQSVERNPSS